MNDEIPKTQRAIQLTGPDTFVLNSNKKVIPPGHHQILCRVEAVGLCFSDLKLVKQFSRHPRKTEVTTGINAVILKQIPSYVPGEAPTVPGHEAVVRICAVGEKITNFKPGQRFLVQTDYRWLPTSNSNAAFGYNFEGALQEYVLMDERIITSPQGESMLIAAPENLSASAIALVEPWACVEDAYVSRERTTLKDGGRMLVVADAEADGSIFASFLKKYGRPAGIDWVSQQLPPPLPAVVKHIEQISHLDNTQYDDVIYFGSKTETVESLFPKVAGSGLLNIVLCGGKLGQEAATYIGRVHYGGIRIIGTTGSDPSKSMQYIPATGEIRPSDAINVIGTGGPMGMMHVVRNVCQGIKGITIYAGDLDDHRLKELVKMIAPLAQKHNVKYHFYNPAGDKLEKLFNYIVLMAPVPSLVAESVKIADRHAIINIFAGIAADVSTKIDLDSYIEKQLYFIGTSGSVLKDMQLVLEKVKSGKLDTNLSVAAICGLEEAINGMEAVEKRTIAGKIIVYPNCKELPLVKLEQMGSKFPSISECMSNGVWTTEAEKELLALY